MRRARPSRRVSSGGAAIPSGAAGACAARSPRRRAGPAASCGWGTERSWRFRWSGGRPGARVNGEGCTGPSAVGWSTGRAFDPSTGGIRSAEGLDVADPLVPRLLRGAALLDAGQGLLHRVVDREVVGALVRRDGDGPGAVGHAASSWASFGWALCFGTVRYEPPQLPPPPGKVLATSQPLTPLALPSMTPTIQPGQSIVAKPSFWKLAVQSSPHCCSLADRPSVIPAWTTWS